MRYTTVRDPGRRANPPPPPSLPTKFIEKIIMHKYYNTGNSVHKQLHCKLCSLFIKQCPWFSHSQLK